MRGILIIVDAVLTAADFRRMSEAVFAQHPQIHVAALSAPPEIQVIDDKLVKRVVLEAVQPIALAKQEALFIEKRSRPAWSKAPRHWDSR
jgi:hypothetical protein